MFNFKANFIDRRGSQGNKNNTHSNSFLKPNGGSEMSDDPAYHTGGFGGRKHFEYLEENMESGLRDVTESDGEGSQVHNLNMS